MHSITTSAVGRQTQFPSRHGVVWRDEAGDSEMVQGLYGPCSSLVHGLSKGGVAPIQFFKRWRRGAFAVWLAALVTVRTSLTVQAWPQSSHS